MALQILLSPGILERRLSSTQGIVSFGFVLPSHENFQEWKFYNLSGQLPLPLVVKNFFFSKLNLPRNKLRCFVLIMAFAMMVKMPIDGKIILCNHASSSYRPFLSCPFSFTSLDCLRLELHESLTST